MAVGALIVVALVGSSFARSTPAASARPGAADNLARSTEHPSSMSTPDQLSWDWVQASETVSPSARAGAATIYDVADGYVLLFGGCPAGFGDDYWGHMCNALGDTWALKDGVWENLTPTLTSPSPPARVDAGIAYDGADGCVVLFGGFNGVTLYNDTWTFSGGHWSEVFPVTSPSPRFGAEMAYDAAAQEVVLFGGQTWTGGPGTPATQFGDTWAYQAGQWVRLNTVNAPAPRYDVAMAYDPLDQSVVLYGGWSNAQTQSYGDTWQFFDNTWSVALSANNPPPENSASMTYDPLQGLLILTGGHVGQNVSTATWGYNATSGWELLPTINAPSPGWGFSLSFDPVSGATWLFGGYDAYGSPTPVGFFYDTTWSLAVLVLPEYAVTFTEIGLPFGTPWGVSIDGTVTSGVGTTLTAYETNGTYSFQVENVSGYDALPSLGDMAVIGPGTSVVITFVAASSLTSSAAGDTSGAFAEGALVGAAVTATVLGVVIFLRPKPPPGAPPLP